MTGTHLESVKTIGVIRPFLTWLVVIVVLKWPALFEPPIWDAAFGLFPAAGELADSNFDLVRLLQQPTYHQGGPNCHAESIVTWVTAGVLALCGKGPSAFVVLHLLNFAAAAWTLAVLHRFITFHLGQVEAWGVCVATLACPVFSVQTSAMYFEIPLTACAVSALVAYADGHIGRAFVWSLLAVMVKQVGIVVPAVLIVAILLRRAAWHKRVALAAGFAIPAFAAAALPLVGTPLLKAAATAFTYTSWWDFMNVFHMPYLKAIPDIALAMSLFLVVGTILLTAVWRSLRTDLAPQSQPDRNLDGTRSTLLFSLGYLQLLAFAGFFFVVPYVCRLEFYCLPRYFVFIIPLMVFGLTQAASFILPRRVVVAGLALATGWFVVNRDGDWYPVVQPNNGAMAERAGSCQRLAEVQQAATLATARVPAESLLLYGLPEHYFLHHPWMGYARQPHPGGRCVTLVNERPESLEIGDLPERFFVLVDAVILGGRELRKIVRDAKADPTRQVRVVGSFVQEPYRVSLYEISRVEQPVASATSANNKE